MHRNEAASVSATPCSSSVAGPIGCIHTSLARIHGADKVFIADISADRLGFAEAFEPDALINASEVDLVDEVMRLTDGKGADVIVTANPAPISIVQAVEVARKDGRILVFGGLPKDNSKPPVDMNLVHYNALYLIGTTTFAPRHYRQAVQLVPRTVSRWTNSSHTASRWMSSSRAPTWRWKVRF